MYYAIDGVGNCARIFWAREGYVTSDQASPDIAASRHPGDKILVGLAGIFLRWPTEHEDWLGGCQGDAVEIFTERKLHPCIAGRITKSTNHPDKLHQFIDRIFAGSPGGLVSYLIKNETIPPDEMEQIRNLIKEKEK